MQRHVEISYRNMDRSEALTSVIEGRAAKLDEVCDRIIGCQVVVEAPHLRHHKGNLYRVRIQLHLPQRELIVGHESHDKHQHEDPYIAVRDAFDATCRQLKDYVRETRESRKSHTASPIGRIAKICLPDGSEFADHGYGTISTRDGRELYFHAHDLLDVKFSQLELGTEVHFVEETCDKGPKASSIWLECVPASICE